ncbi:MAG: aminoglycoside phosphotransferase family protein [Bacillota bacterium]|nr:aminoglycoside phosphotransferase family protein [Bacillota bacterium]
MIKGELIGKGMTAEVYSWGNDKVLKLYFEQFSGDWISREAKIGSLVHDAGVPSPKVFDIIDMEGRKGLIFRRIFGKSLFKHVEAEPWMLYQYAKETAGFHYKIHKYSVDGLPSQKEIFINKINRSSKILGSRLQKIYGYLQSLEDGTSICHGDLHFGNIIVSNNKLVAIDWNGAYIGNPLGDVARTCMIMNSPAMPDGAPDIIVTPAQYIKWLTYWTYANEYMRLSKARFEDIDAWKLPVAAAKLKDKIHGEEKWLMNIIDESLEKLNA